MNKLNFDNIDFRMFIDLLKTGNNPAWKLFLERYRLYIINVAKKISFTTDPEDLEDILCNVNLKLTDKNYHLLNRFYDNTEISFKRYLFRITKLSVYEYNRKTRNIFSNDLAIENATAKQLLPKINLEDLVSGLSDIKTQIFYLRYYGYKNKEISEKLNISINTVLSHFNRSKHIVQQNYNKYVIEY